jgi:hypothetical protein
VPGVLRLRPTTVSQSVVATSRQGRCGRDAPNVPATLYSDHIRKGNIPLSIATHCPFWTFLHVRSAADLYDCTMPIEESHKIYRRYSDGPSLDGGVALFTILGAVGGFTFLLVIVLCVWNQCRPPSRTNVDGVRLMRVSNRAYRQSLNEAAPLHGEPAVVGGEETLPQYSKMAEPGQPVPGNVSHGTHRDANEAPGMHQHERCGPTLPPYQQCGQ